MNNNYSELYHYGIQGQKWGIRRFQNEDGSLTNDGKLRYETNLDGKRTKKAEKKYIKDLKDHRRQEIKNKVKIKDSTLTKEELDRLHKEGTKTVLKLLGTAAGTAVAIRYGEEIVGGVMTAIGSLAMASVAVKIS